MNYVKKNIDKILFFFLMSFLVGDFLTNLVHEFNRFKEVSFFYRYAGLIKLFFEVFMLIMIAFNLKKLSRVAWVILIISASFVIGQYLLSTVVDYDIKSHMFVGNIYFFNRYIYLLIFILFVQTVEIKTETFEKIYKYLEYFLYLNAIAIALGILFRIELFRSYEYTPRFGVSGLFSKPGEASYMYIIAIIVNYYYWIVKENKIYLFKLLFFILCSLCLGQKKIILFLIMLGIIFLVRNNRFKKFFCIALPIGFTFFIFFQENIVKTVLNFFPFWENIYNQSGLISTITSYRNELLETVVSHIEATWTFLNYIFGGLDFETYKVEFEFIDLYIFLGLAGILYYVCIVSIFLNRSDFLKRILIIITFATSLLSGGLLLNVTSVIFLYITAKYIMKSNNKLVEHN